MGNVTTREIDKIRERASLDRLVDKSLIHYEKQSMVKKSDEDDLLEWALMTHRVILLAEADEDKGDKSGPTPSPDTGESTLDPEEFAANVAMLCENHERLLDIHTAISNRAYLYVTKNYDKDLANRFREILASKFKIYLDPDDKPVAPEFIGLTGKPGAGT
jgi:hypothetical protein